MTEALDTTPPTYEELAQQVQELTDTLAAERASREEEHVRTVEELARLHELVSRLDTLDQITGERNTARQNLREEQQEVARMRGVLQEMVAGVQNWVPDLTPVPAPPPELDPAVADAWVRDQIAARRADWDRFVHRVVTQATV